MGGLTGEIITNSLTEVVPIALLISATNQIRCWRFIRH